nr:glycosyltransferase [uncultured Methanoregula sp.]
MKTICFRVDAGNRIGMGHLMECIALTEYFRRESKVTVEFISNDFPPLKEIVAPLDIPVRILGLWDNEKDELSRMEELFGENKPDILICDLLNRSKDYYSGIRSLASHTAVILDDEIPREIPGDLVINFSITQDPTFYSRFAQDKIRYCIGPAFMPLSEQFKTVWSRPREIPENCRTIFVNQGGSDPYGLTLKIIRSLELLQLNQIIHIIMGDAITEQHRKELQAVQKNLKNQCVFEWGVSHKRMLEVMEESDIAITAAGNTLYELAIFGIPSIVICHHERHNVVADAFEQRGAAINMGIGISLDEQKIADTVSVLLKNRPGRSALSREMKKLVDGDGCKRIFQEVNRIW